MHVYSNMKVMFQLLDDIAELFYGVQRRNPLQGMFGDILKVLILLFPYFFQEYLAPALCFIT